MADPNLTPTLDTTAVRRWKRYPEYRPVQTETLRELPASWKLNRLKFVTRINPEVLDESTDPDYELRYIDIGNVDSLGRVQAEQSFRFEDAPSRARRRVRHGDVIISTVRTYLRAIAAIENPPDNQIVSTGFAVLRPGKEYEPRFLWRLIQSSEFVETVVNHSEGVGYPAINPSELGGLPVWMPPLSKQRAIAAFLDRETARIDTLIERKERLIALLEEKRQAVVSHAVTRGLEADILRKPVALEWLDSVPLTWTVQRNATLFTERDERGYPELPILEVSIRTGVTVREFSPLHTEQMYEDPAMYKRARQGDLVFNKMRMWQGAVGVAPVDGLVSPDYTVAKPRDGVNALYFAQLFRTPLYMTEIDRYSHGMVKDRNRLYWDDFKQMPSLVPPVAEQHRIIDHIRRVNGHNEAVMSKIQEGIARLQEYRTALISAAVTGQIDVRHETAAGNGSS